MDTRIDQLFIGALRPLPPEGQLTGMYKSPVAGPVAVASEGLARAVMMRSDRRAMRYPAIRCPLHRREGPRGKRYRSP